MIGEGGLNEGHLFPYTRLIMFQPHRHLFTDLLILHTKTRKILYRFNFASDMIDKINDSIDYTKTLYFLVEPSTFL